MISLDLEYVFRNENAYETLIRAIVCSRMESREKEILQELLALGREQYREEKECAT